MVRHLFLMCSVSFQAPDVSCGSGTALNRPGSAFQLSESSTGPDKHTHCWKLKQVTRNHPQPPECLWTLPYMYYGMGQVLLSIFKNNIVSHVHILCKDGLSLLPARPVPRPCEALRKGSCFLFKYIYALQRMAVLVVQFKTNEVQSGSEKQSEMKRKKKKYNEVKRRKIKWNVMK